jgi:predicted nucleic acid-binding protein
VSASPVVSNASPLISLDRIHQLALLQQVFGTITVPPAVVRETAARLTLPAWIVEQPLNQPLAPVILGASLGAGESETLALALEVRAAWVVLDDRPARRLAQALGLPVMGTLGVLLVAKRRGLLSVIRPSLDALVQTGFYVAPPLYDQVLQSAGEKP